MHKYGKKLKHSFFYTNGMILTKRMKDFIERPEKFPGLEKRVYKHLLRKRLAETLKELEYINEKIINGALPGKIMGNAVRPSKPGVGGSSPPGPVN